MLSAHVDARPSLPCRAADVESPSKLLSKETPPRGVELGSMARIMIALTNYNHMLNAVVRVYRDANLLIAWVLLGWNTRSARGCVRKTTVAVTVLL